MSSLKEPNVIKRQTRRIVQITDQYRCLHNIASTNRCQSSLMQKLNNYYTICLWIASTSYLVWYQLY